MLAADEALSIGDNTTQADAGAGIAAEEVNPAMSRGDSATQVDTFGVTSKLRERFELLEELGRGGMGVVHKARDRQLGRLVALKRLNADSSENQRAIKRFRKEARSIAALDHANIVRIYNLFEDDLGICIELEYVEGGDLESLVEREGALPPEQVREVGAQLCDALALAHEKGIIHRDIKPANVLLTPRGMPKLTDFGLAQDQHGTHTMTGALLGTPLYAAPEQLKSGKHVDGRSDLYALGATLYTLAVGEMPRPIRLDRAIALKFTSGAGSL